MKYHSIKKDNLKDYTKPAFLIGSSKLLQKYNMTSLKDYVTVGFNEIYYYGYSPTFICINDIKILQKYPVKDIFACEYSKYVISKEIYVAYKIKIDDCCENHRIYLIDEINVDLGCEDIVSFDSDFKYSYQSYSVILDLAIPLIKFLGIKYIYLIGIDYKYILNLSKDKNITKNALNYLYHKVFTIFDPNYKSSIFNMENSMLPITLYHKKTLNIPSLMKTKYNFKNKIIKLRFFSKMHYFFIVDSNITIHPETVSLLSVSNCINYVRCYHNRIRLEKPTFTSLYDQQTTFYLENQDHNKVCFRSYYYPQKYVSYSDKYNPISSNYNYYRSPCINNHYLYDSRDLFDTIYFFDNEYFVLPNIIDEESVSFKNINNPTNSVRIHNNVLIQSPLQYNKQYLHDSTFKLHLVMDDLYYIELFNKNKFLSYGENNSIICGESKDCFKIVHRKNM